MTILEAVQKGAMLFLFVFLVLAVLYVLILIFSAIVKGIEKVAVKPAVATAGESGPTPSATPAAPTAQPTGVWGGEMRLKKVDEPTAAMIMAIVSDESGIPLSELCFKSISLVEPDDNKQEEA